MKKQVFITPRISLNSLAEYDTNASSTRRSSIIRNAKEKPTYIMKRYNEAEAALADFLATGASSRVLLDQITYLRTKSYTTPFDRTCGHSSADALEAYRNGLWIGGLLSDYKVEVAINQKHHKTIIEGVQISVRPELILRDKVSGQQLGFVKFYTRQKPLIKPQGELIACLGKYYFQEEHLLSLKPKHCFVIDVFSGDVIGAPKAFTKRISDVKNSCKEIADRWNLL